MRWLLDEMLPPAAAEHLRSRGHEALSVFELDLDGAPDAQVFEVAVQEDRVIVTENFADYSTLAQQRLAQNLPSVPVVFLRKSGWRPGRGLAVHLAGRLDEWAAAHPTPYVGIHWL